MSNPITSDHPPLFQPVFGQEPLKQWGATGSQPAPTPGPDTNRAGPTRDVTQPRRQGSVTPAETEATRSVPSRELLRVEDAAARLAIGRTSMFALIKAGVIESVKVDRVRYVPADAITDYINRLVPIQRAG